MIRDQRLEIRGQRSEISGQKLEVRKVRDKRGQRSGKLKVRGRFKDKNICE